MNNNESNFFTKKLTSDERKRLDRQLRLPGWNQTALKESSVLIAGVGGLGTEIAKNLAMAGVGTIHLVDMDTIEHTNLNRQILFSNADEGESKAEVAAKALARINPNSRYVPHHSKLEDLDPQIYLEVDVYISGLDSVQARWELNRRAVHNKKPIVDGGTATYYGHVYSHLPDENACLACDPLRERERETLAACTLVGIPRKRSHCLLKGQLYFESKFGRAPIVSKFEEISVIIEYANKLLKEHFPDKKEFSPDETVALIDHHEPTVITINAVIASLQSQEVVKLLHHAHGVSLGIPLQEYAIYNGLIGKFFYLEKQKNPKCELCSESATPFVPVVIPPSTTISTITSILTAKGFTGDYDIGIAYYRLDGEMEEVDENMTVLEAGIRNGETILATGLIFEDEGAEVYVQIRYR